MLVAAPGSFNPSNLDDVRELIRQERHVANLPKFFWDRQLVPVVAWWRRPLLQRPHRHCPSPAHHRRPRRDGPFRAFNLLEASRSSPRRVSLLRRLHASRLSHTEFTWFPAFVRVTPASITRPNLSIGPTGAVTLPLARGPLPHEQRLPQSLSDNDGEDEDMPSDGGDDPDDEPPAGAASTTGSPATQANPPSQPAPPPQRHPAARLDSPARRHTVDPSRPARAIISRGGILFLTLKARPVQAATAPGYTSRVPGGLAAFPRPPPVRRYAVIARSRSNAHRRRAHKSLLDFETTVEALDLTDPAQRRRLPALLDAVRATRLAAMDAANLHATADASAGVFWPTSWLLLSHTPEHAHTRSGPETSGILTRVVARRLQRQPDACFPGLKQPSFRDEELPPWSPRCKASSSITSTLLRHPAPPSVFLVFIDHHKAYDRVDRHCALALAASWSTAPRLSLSPSSPASSRGDPLSGVLYNIALQPLLDSLQRGGAGVTFSGLGRLGCLAFADDNDSTYHGPAM
ncbi:hypothetical protein V8E36_008678 [Tilletia maclaganii]